jgi:hypothetical protein
MDGKPNKRQVRAVVDVIIVAVAERDDEANLGDCRGIMTYTGPCRMYLIC